MKVLRNPIDFCVVLPDNRRTFEYFQSFVVALAKSQDHRVIYGVFCVWWLCNAVLSVVAFRDTLLHERTKAGAVGEG